MTTWLPEARVHDLHPAIGNGPFRDFRGVVLHVNVDPHGTPDHFWGNGNPGQVCPNFQVFKDGSFSQMLPLDWQPWCQRDGNFQYAAIETAGMPDEPLTDAQLNTCAKILRAYHVELGAQYLVADHPGDYGLITHQAGGAAWGGHSCPGSIRAAQRAEIIRRAQALGAKPATPAKPAKPVTIYSWFPYRIGSGNVLGPRDNPSAKVHGGVDAYERRYVAVVQRVVGAHDDGVWGPDTTAKVVAWQRRTKRKVTGRFSRWDWLAARKLARKAAKR